MPRRPKNDPAAPDLSVERLVRVAIELIDADGLESFGLRKLAREVGAGNMSVYYYVQDRDHLLALVLDEILGSISLKRLPADPLDAVAALARRFVAAFAEHPGTIPLFALQPIYSIGPNGVRLFDHLVGLLDRAGLSKQAVVDTTVALFEYLSGHLVGHLPQARDHDYTVTVDQVLASMTDDVGANLRKFGPEFRRTASTLQPDAGIELLLAGHRRAANPAAGNRTSA